MRINIFTMFGNLRAVYAISGQSNLKIDEDGQHINLKRQF